MKDVGGDGLHKYERIAADLRSAIESGDYGPGDQLPGENQLKDSYGVALMTVRQSLDVLKSEGIAESRKGKGVFVRSSRLNRTPADAFDPRPLHERIATDLRRDILSGDLGPGDRLPSTEQLKCRFSASSATVQKALGILKDERLVHGRPGASVQVLEARRESMAPSACSPSERDSYRWLTQAKKQGKRASIKLIEVAEVRPPRDVAYALELGEEGLAVMRKQLLSFDPDPCELVKSYYPLELALGTALMEHRKIKGGTPTLLASMGFPPRRTFDEVSAEEPTTEEYEALLLPRQVPVLRTLRVVLSDDARPIEATTMAKAGHLYSLRYEF